MIRQLQHTLKISLLVILGFLVLCLTSCSENANSVPADVKKEVEEILKKREAKAGFNHEKLVGFKWSEASVKNADSCVYPFSVIFEREGKNYPFKFRCITKDDTLCAILKFSHMANNWISVQPEPYDVRKEDWWVELKEINKNIELIYDTNSLEMIDGPSNSWREVYHGNVILKTESVTIRTDTLYWQPDSMFIQVPSGEFEFQKNDRLTTFSGSGFTLKSDFSSWTIDRLSGSFNSHTIDSKK